MSNIRFLFCFLFLSLVSCSPKLLPATINIKQPIDNYKYFYVSPTAEKQSEVSTAYSNSYYHLSKTTNPRDIIAGYLIKRGFISLPELNPQLLDNTFIVNYGESGRRSLGIKGYTLEVTIQFLTAHDYSVLCTCSAEGCGSTEADDIQIAINRALNALFEN